MRKKARKARRKSAKKKGRSHRDVNDSRLLTHMFWVFFVQGRAATAGSYGGAREMRGPAGAADNPMITPTMYDRQSVSRIKKVRKNKKYYKTKFEENGNQEQ